MKTNITRIAQSIEEQIAFLNQHIEQCPDYIHIKSLESACELLQIPHGILQIEKNIKSFIQDVQRAYCFYRSTDVFPDCMKTGHKKTEQIFHDFFTQVETENFVSLAQEFWIFFEQNSSKDVSRGGRLYTLEQAQEQYQLWQKYRLQSKTQFRKKARQMKKFLDGLIGVLDCN